MVQSQQLSQIREMSLRESELSRHDVPPNTPVKKIANWKNYNFDHVKGIFTSISPETNRLIRRVRSNIGGG